MNRLKMKNWLLLVVCQLVLVLGCKEKSHPPAESSTMNRDEFVKLDGTQQAGYFNTLEKDKRMSFLNEILPNSTLGVLPDSEILLLANGDYVFAPDSMEFTIGQWTIEGDKITFSKTKGDEKNYFLDEDSVVLTLKGATDSPKAVPNHMSLEFQVNKTTETWALDFDGTENLLREDAMKFYNQAKTKK